jgi:hypothetical protein
VADGHEEDIRNRALDLLDRLPRSVFRQVFALTLSEMAGLEADSWAEVQDRLVSAMGARDLIPPRDAADRLEEEAGALWRPNRRGNQVVRQLGERIHLLEQERDRARAQDRELRELVARVADGREELERLQAQRLEIQRSEERLGRLFPVHRQLQRIQALEQEAGDSSELEGLPPDPAAGLETLRERAASLAARGNELESLEETLTESRRRAESLCGDLLGRPWTEKDRARIRRVSPVAVRESVRSYLQSRDTRRLAEAGKVPSVEDVPALASVPERLGLAAIVAGVLAIVAGSLLDQPWLTGLGLVAAGLGGWSLFRLLRSLRARARSRASSPSTALSTSTADLLEAEGNALAAVRAALSGLDVRADILRDPTLELPAWLQRLQELDRDIDAQTTTALRLAPPDTPDQSSEPPAGQLTLGLGGLPSSTGANGSGTTVDDAPAGADGSETARDDLESDPDSLARARLASAKRSVRQDQQQVEADRVSLEKRLSLLGEGDADRGARVALARLVARRTGRELYEDLSRAHSDLADIQEEIVHAVREGEAWIGDPHAMRTLQRHRVQLTDRIEHLGRTLERDDLAIARLRELPTADEVGGEILSLREGRRSRAEERDRKILLAKVIRMADQRFRSERQPRVLRRAGTYLGRITGGRYDRIITAEEGERDVFKLLGDHVDRPVDLHQAASTGTREQAYLALRLAAVDELDGGGERLPVFVDEVFVNWDDERRQRGIGLVAGLAEDRQVFVFTCHADVAHALENLGGQVVSLEAGRLRSLEGAT